MQLHFKQLGQGGPLILLHGLFGSADNWHAVAHGWRNNFSLRSGSAQPRPVAARRRRWIIRSWPPTWRSFSSRKKLKARCVIGHSMGGKMAMQFALQFSGAVEKLVVADMAPRAYRRRTSRFSPRCWRVDLQIISDPSAN